MKKKIMPLKTKLLKQLRYEAKERIGVFRNKKDTFDVVYYRGNLLSGYGLNEYVTYSCSKERQKVFQILEKNVESQEKAIKMCDYYRRCFILQKVRKMKYGTSDRYY